MPLQEIEPIEPGDISSLLQPEVEPEVEAPPQDTPPVESAPPAIDYDKIGASVGDAITKAFPKAPEPVPVASKMSQEEVDKLLKKWEPDDAFIERFSNISTQKEAMKELFNRAADHAEARAQVNTYGAVKSLQDQIQPRLTEFEQWQAQQREARFNTRYSELANPALKPVIAAVANQIFATQKFASEEEAFDAVAKGAERTIQITAPTFKLARSGKKASNPNELPTMSSGAGGGGGHSTPAPVKGPPGIELFNSLR